jgi:CheY-like chemotaxis protein
MRSFPLWPFSRNRLVASSPRLTVLIADDDPCVRAELEQFVSRRGCHAFFAADGTAALRCLTMARDVTRHLGPIHVVIADTDLPGRSGIDLLVVAKGHHWDLDVVLTTDVLSPVLRDELRHLGAAAVLTKPVSLPELERALARIQTARQER